MTKKKHNILKTILRISFMVFVVAVVSISISLYKIDLESLRSDLINVLRDQTGLAVEIDGEISWQFSLRPRVALENVRIPNADWAQNSDFVNIEKVFATLNLFSLLRDRPTIESIRLENAIIHLEKNEHGEYSVKPEINASEHTNAGHSVYPFEIALGSLELSKPKLHFIAHGYESAFEPDNLKIDSRQIKGKLEYRGYVSKSKKVYPFVISFAKLDEARKVYPVKVAFADDGAALVADLALEMTSRIPIDFKLVGTIKDLQSLLNNFDLDIPKVSPITINAAGGFGHSILTLRRSSFASRGGDFNISGAVDWSGDIPIIKLKLDSGGIVLADLFPTMYGGDYEKWVRPNRELNIFKDTSLYVPDFMVGLEMTLDADVAGLVIYREFGAKDIKLHADVKDSALKLKADFSVAGGSISASAAARMDGGTLVASAAGRGINVSTGEIMKQIREDNFISGLPVNFEFYLESMGHDLTSFMSNVSGPVRVKSAGSGYAHSDLVGYMYGQDFLTSLRHSVEDLLSRDNSRSERMKISCAALNLKFRNGYVETERGIATESAAVNIRATGFVDLGHETLRASLVSTPVRGLKLSISKNVINSIEFSGNLAEPDIKINGGAVAAKAISATGIGLLLAPFTGGIGLLAGAGVGFLAGDLLESWLADDSPCYTALKYGAPEKEGDPEWLNAPIEELVGKLL